MLIQLNESTASNRIVYIWSVLSNGTSPAQFEAGGQPTISVAGLAAWNSAGTLLSVSTINGEYQVRLGTSDVSVAGPGILRYSSTSAIETSIPIQIVGFNPYGSISTFDASVLSVNLNINAIKTTTIVAGTYSGVTVGINNIAAGTYSGATVGVNLIDKAAFAVSGVSAVPAPGTFSATTVQVNGIAAATYSGVTVGVNNIAAGTYSGATVGMGSASTAAGNTIADSLLLRNVAGGASSGHTIGEAFAAMRNATKIDGSTWTVYRDDGTTSFYTGSLATVSTNSGLIISMTPKP